MLFKARLILASAAVPVLFVFMFVSHNLRAEHAGDAERRAIDLENTERSVGEPSIGDPSSSTQRRAMAENQNCTPEAGPCDQANGSPGCDDSACCNSVCDLDPYCCDVAWDELCAGPNEIVPGASCIERFNGPGQPCETAGVGMPDIIVVGIGGHSGENYEAYLVGDIAAFSSGTTACNVGTAEADWQGSTNRHPLIAQNMYRLSPDGRQFEMIGMSWLKHGFCALDEFCSGCQSNNNCDLLGIGCADTYTAHRNGTATVLGPRRDINPLGLDLDGTGPGTHTHPYTNPAGDSMIRGRIQVHTADLGQPGAAYFVEIHYVTHDEPLALRANNVSWVEVQMPSTPPYTIANAGPETQEQSALHAWQASDPGVVIASVSDADGGLFEVAYRVTQNPPDGSGTFTWRYEYAVHNTHSYRAARSFRVAVASNVTLSNVGFHDVDYHSGDGHPSAGGSNFDGADWSATLANGFVEWQMDFGSDINNANALRWGTTYNFRFDADTPPTEAPAELVHYRNAAGTPPANDVLAFAALGPSLPISGCGDLTCDAGEDCQTCPSDCASHSSGCGNGLCEPTIGEDCLSCAADCRGKQNGEPNHQYCCGGGGQHSDPVGCDDGRCSTGGFQCSDVPADASCCGDGVCEGVEDELGCAVDCLTPCVDDTACDDSDNCTVDVCLGDGTCDHTPVACGLDGEMGDGCCGPGCDAGNDADCACSPKNSPCGVNSDCCSNKCVNDACRGS